MKTINIKFPSNKKILLTKKGLDDLRSKLNSLSKERANVCKRLLKMDSKEREEYIISTNILRMLEKNDQEITKITDILMNADVVVKNENKSCVGLGSVVSLKHDDTVKKFTIVNSIEANPSENMISEESPLGQALIGKKRRSSIRLLGNNGRHYRYKLLDIS